jgi:hypothetical protein
MDRSAARHERPRDCSAAEQRDEIAASHSITLYVPAASAMCCRVTVAALSDVTRNGKGAAQVCSISFEGERRMVPRDAGGVPPFSQKGTPPPPSLTF